MAQFPGVVPAMTDINGAQTLAAAGHSSKHNLVHREIEAIAAKVGADSSAVQTSHDYKLSGVTGANKAETTANKDTDTTLAANSDTKYASQKAIKAYVDGAISTAVTAAKAALYPVGSIYFNAGVATNPGTLLGFGTWTAWGSGRVPVGVDAGQTEFDTLEETGGAKTHTLVQDEMPSHIHSIGYGGSASTVANVAGSYTVRTSSSGNSGSTGGDGAHNNLQPYITVYMWKRTA